MIDGAGAGSAGGAHAVLVSEIFPPAVGGSGVLFANTYSRLKGVQVTVLTRAVPDEADYDSGSLLICRDLVAAPYWGLLRGSGLHHHWRLASRLRRLCRPNQAVVHAARALPEGVTAWLARRRGGSPYVCWAHGEDIVSAGASREFSFLMRHVYRGAACLIANSRNTAAMLKAVGGSDSKIDVVYPGVDPSRFRPDAPGAGALRARFVKDGQLLLLTVGRLQRRKGHDLVLRTLAELAKRDIKLRYVIVGDGEERERLERMTVELGIADLVHFAGIVSDEDLPGYYAAADIFVHPNRVDDGDLEGFGIVFLEAAASGLPVIAGDSGGVPEAVAADRTGFLVTGTSCEELTQALVRLTESPNLRHAMGTAGRTRAEQEFSWDSAAKKLLSIQLRISSEMAGQARS